MVSAFTQGGVNVMLYRLLSERLEEYPTITDGPSPDYNYSNSNCYLRLNKALYRLKQSARFWYYKLTNALVENLGFTSPNSESCIFINRTTKIIICIYVDDLAIVGGPNRS